MYEQVITEELFPDKNLLRQFAWDSLQKALDSLSASKELFEHTIVII